MKDYRHLLPTMPSQNYRRYDDLAQMDGYEQLCFACLFSTLRKEFITTDAVFKHNQKHFYGTLCLS
jgi:hypothetical protein